MLDNKCTKSQTQTHKKLGLCVVNNTILRNVPKLEKKNDICLKCPSWVCDVSDGQGLRNIHINL